MAREIRQIKRDVERRRKSWMTTAIPEKKTLWPSSSLEMRTSRLVVEKKKSWRRSSLTSTRMTSMELSVTGCVWERERESDTADHSKLFFPLEPRYLCNEKSYQRHGKKLLRKKGIKNVEMLTVIRCHVWIIFKLKYLMWSTTTMVIIR